MRPRCLIAAAVLCLSAVALALAGEPDPRSPETVLVTYHVRPGSEAAMDRILREEHWPLLRKLKFVFESPHVLVRGVEDGGKPYFCEILTWRDHDTPDNAPPEVQAVWDRMKPLVEKRGGDAIDIQEVTLIVPGARPAAAR